MGVVKEGGIIHCVGHCTNCDAEWSDYLSAQAAVRKHVERTGHTVELEVGSSYTYSKKE